MYTENENVQRLVLHVILELIEWLFSMSFLPATSLYAYKFVISNREFQNLVLYEGEHRLRQSSRRAFLIFYGMQNERLDFVIFSCIFK